MVTKIEKIVRMIRELSIIEIYIQTPYFRLWSDDRKYFCGSQASLNIHL